ncbi:MAG: DinB family protein [bacterium]|nr:DinB family protein [bacterium]
MEYKFLVDTYDTERFKTLNVWSMFKDDDLLIRPHKEDKRGRNLLEHMIHQCAGENKWFCKMFGIDVGAPPLPSKETRFEFIKRYAEDSEKRLAALKEKDKVWWEEETGFFNTKKPKTWIMTRRIAHTAHHRGEQVTLLRILGRNVYSVYGPSADTGGLPDNNAQTIYAYPDLESLINGETKGGAKATLLGSENKPCTERP